MKDKNVGKEHLYALVPIDLSKPAEKHSLVKTCLLVMFPSDFALCAKISFQLFDRKYLYWSSYEEWPFYSSGVDYYDNFLHFSEGSLNEINEFISLFVSRYQKLSYLETNVTSYTSSFSELSQRMEYLALCISLESIIDGKNELSYRIKRNAAIICGKTEDDCWTIFNNIDKIYNLRSQIVHGENYDHKKLTDYLPYLKNLVSRLILELVCLNIVDKKTLNSKLTAVGFGERSKINPEYKHYSFNPRPILKLWSDLKK